MVICSEPRPRRNRCNGDETMSGLLCFLFGHDWYLIARITGRSRHVGCHRCGRQWGMNDDARALLPWGDVADFHAEAHGYLAHQTAEERE
jgi:hypothetical protein